jgi:very-short-patch-repair endonuclease
MEASLWNALRLLRTDGHHFRRQVPLGRYFADFACHASKLVIEVDGDTHVSPTYDRTRDRFIEGEGYRVLRVTNDDVRNNLDGVISVVLQALDESPVPSPPSPRWGGIEGGVELQAGRRKEAR